MSELIMLIGLPGSGKSTWIQEFRKKNPDYVVVSSDDIIEELGALQGLNYADSFVKNSRFSMREMDRRAKTFIAQGLNIIWDQTNMTVKSRKKKLAMAEDYVKMAVVFNISDPELKRRQEKRKQEVGKTVPPHVIAGMANSYQAPTKAEGFSKITYVRD